jgi:RNA polymerase sigma factor (sigma-70 family)
MRVNAGGASEAEIEALYRAKFEHFVRVAVGITGDAHLGVDAVQNGFVAAVRHRHSFRRKGPLEAWVWQIVVNEARSMTRREDLELDDKVDAAAQNGDALGDDPFGVGRYIASLPPRQREAVFLRYFADLDYRTIATVLDIAPGTVSATLSAAHQTLRKKLEANRR